MGGMVEVLVIFGLLGWLFLTFLEWFSTLPVFPAVVTAAVICPILSVRHYLRLIRTWKLRGIYSNRDPIPPERFYWAAQRIRLQRSIILGCGLAEFVRWYSDAKPCCQRDSLILQGFTMVRRHESNVSWPLPPIHVQAL
jgi:hypothetical protein